MIQIDNFVLFTRLTPELLKERFESGQVIKEFFFESESSIIIKVIKDFIVLEHERSDDIEFLTVGQDQMISWWKYNDNSHQNQSTVASSIIGYFFTTPKQQQEKPTVQKNVLQLVRFLNEPDRCIDKILTFSDTLALLEDSSHGRLLLLDTEHALILKTFKGYRNSCAFMKTTTGNLLIWSGNRFCLEEWTGIPFGDTKKSLINEAVDSSASFDANGSFFLFSKKSHQLEMYN